MPKNVIYVIRVESVEAFQKLFRKVSKIKNALSNKRCCSCI
ncbi:hypothetical protein SACOL0094 [Staphylococcus aureus subsp. aureus COL]|uniref:Uncharacterized protein n=1 Tax=Staphylococcus aureus (strain COL) TaxID=93062 RepID=A0A0H2X209_STAAC|nr:hypothetical protein SACOL0094 [Staphylococcus aureus subsp. aureus COL]EFW31401.1 hypothetical protein HMPREF9528_02203 [Staphylococcus aureus subsp. aureus MRSA131]KAJ47873.1 hypothetical protein HMPREF1625_00655 [Staphylococcus aureus 880]